MAIQLTTWRRPAPGSWMLPLLALPALALLIRAYEAPLVLIALLTVAGAVCLLIWPESATLTGVFILYLNVPGVALLHGAPKPFAALFIVLLFLPLLHYLVFRRERPRFDAAFALMLVFLAVMLLSSLGAKDKSVALVQVLTYVVEGLALYWLIINTVRSITTLRRVVWAVLAAGAVLASLSIYQSVTGSYTQQFGGFAERNVALEYKREADVQAGVSQPKLYRVERAEGPLLGNNRYAQVMLVLLPLALLRLRNANSRRSRVAAAVTGLLIVYGGVLLTYSRGALLALIAMGCAAAFVKWMRPRLIVISGVCMLLILPITAPVLVKRIGSLGAVADLEDPSTDSSLRGRATEMLAALNVFFDYPLLGVGPAQYTPFYSVEYQQLPGIKFRDIQTTRRAHSLYIEMAAEVGIIGLVVFMAIPLLLMRELWRARRHWAARHPELADTAAALWLGFISFGLTAVFLSHAYERYYWLLMAMAGATLQVMKQWDHEDPERRYS